MTDPNPAPTTMWHRIAEVDMFPLPVLFHECPAHKRVGDMTRCTCGQCVDVPPTPCNCSRPIPCTACERGETPLESEARLAVIDAQLEMHGR